MCNASPISKGTKTITESEGKLQVIYYILTHQQ